MGRRIPVRVVRSTEFQTTPPAEEAVITATKPHLDTPLPVDRDSEVHVKSLTGEQAVVAVESHKSLVKDTEAESVAPDELRDELKEWRDRAMRLQADMENHRKRQQRLAQDQIAQERSRLLNAFLGIVDDLERALTTPASDDQLSRGAGLRRGVELTHRAAIQLLEKEGAAAIPAEHQPFDPNLHEAVATVPRNGSAVAPGTVIEVIEPGYRLDGKLLRPAKVVVAV